MTRREALASAAAGIAAVVLNEFVGPLWTLYVIAVAAILWACWRQAGELTAAQNKLESMRERKGHG